jgi:hypothetical protein
VRTEPHGGRAEAPSDGLDRGSEIVIHLPAFIEHATPPVALA